MEQINLSKETLTDLYITQGLNSEQIRNKTGFSTATICKYLKLYNIPIRTRRVWNRGITAKDDARVAKFVEAGKEARTGLTPWNAGLTKDTDERIAKQADYKTEWHKKHTTKYQHITKDFLEQEYLVNGKSLIQIAKELGFKHSARIQKIAMRYGIPIRSKQENALLKHKDKIPTKEQLYDMYFVQKKGFFNLVEELDIPRCTLDSLFEQYGFDRRSRFAWNKGKEYTILVIPQDELMDLYVNQKLSLHDCAKHFDCCGHTISDRLTELNIAIRPMSGETHALYGKEVPEDRRRKISITLGGTGDPKDSNGGYVNFTSDLKEAVRKRDNYCCQECGFTNDEQKVLSGGKSLSCHHIDYNKENSTEDNLISLCDYCHAKTTVDREYWQDYFQTKMQSR